MDTYNATPVAQPTESTMTVGEWMLTTFLMMIPCVGLIMMFIWAFGDTKNTKPTKSNYAKAMLIWYAISIVISIICSSAIAGIAATIASQM